MLLRMVLVIKNRGLEAFFKEHFTQPNAWVESLGHLKNSFQKAVRTNGDIFVVDLGLMPKPIESAIALLNDLPENPTTIVLHDNDSPRKQADLITLGADVVLYSGLPKKALAEAIEATMESRYQLTEKPWPGRRTVYPSRISGFISESPSMKIFMDMVQKAIPCNVPVLILGETGSGKEHLAKLMHSEGPRAAGPFIAVNCPALPESLLESELFGHEAGAFTGAVRARRGAFELAHGGTVFLDEIGELSPHMQAKLLRVLQEYEIRPVGSEKSVWVDIRVIAATNRDIEQEIEKGAFRRDLYYRLSVFTLTVPSLRDRREDIPNIVNEYVANVCKKLNKEANRISEDALKVLMQYEWPGNVRELINVIERAVILCHGGTITLKDLPQGICERRNNHSLINSLIDPVSPGWGCKKLAEIRGEVLEIVERSYLQRVLTETRGQVGVAAQRAGIHPRGLFNKMKKYGFRKEDFKSGSTLLS